MSQDERDFIPCRYCNGTLPEAGEMEHEPTCPWNLGKLAAIEAIRRGNHYGCSSLSPSIPEPLHTGQSSGPVNGDKSP